MIFVCIFAGVWLLLGFSDMWLAGQYPYVRNMSPMDIICIRTGRAFSSEVGSQYVIQKSQVEARGLVCGQRPCY